MAIKAIDEEIEKKCIQLEQKIKEYEGQNTVLKDTLHAFNLLTKANREAVIIFTGNLILYTNDQFCSLFGYQRQEIDGEEAILSTIAPEYVETVRQKIGIGGTEPYETVALRKDGTRVPIEINTRETTYLGKKALAATIREITKRTKAEEALQETEERYRSIVETMHDGLGIQDENGLMTYNNKRFCEMVGYRPDEIIGKPAEILYDPQNRKILKDQITKRKKGSSVRSYEIELTAKDGEKISAICSPQDIFNAKGEYKGSFAIFTDITAWKQSEKASKESEEKFRSLFHLSPQPVGLLEADTGIVIDVNERFCELTKYTREEILGHTTTGLGFYSEKERSRVVREFRKAEALNGLEILLNTKDQSIRDVLMFSRSIWIEGKKLIIAIFVDVTERKRIETQLQQSHKMEAIGTLAGGIAHDFNNMLGVILGNTELALGDVPEWNPAYHNLEEVRKACLRARDVVRQILAFSRDSGQELNSVKIGPIIKESLKFLRSSIPTTIEIHQALSCESDTIKADPTQINQILLNLCTNAAYAMRESGGTLKVSLQNVRLDETMAVYHQNVAPGSYVRLTVSDTGHGIAPEIMGRIFDPYFTTKGIGEGTGIGLAVVHGIVNKHGGVVTVQSQVDKGTSFHVFFPCIEEVAIGEIVTSERLPKGNEQILFVDDEKAIVDSILPILERLGYSVKARTSSVEALEAFRYNPKAFDLVITDQTMPNMTGVEFAREIGKIQPNTPIILCTGFSESVNEKKAKELGINGFIMKPFKTSEIANAIRKALDDGEE